MLRLKFVFRKELFFLKIYDATYNIYSVNTISTYAVVTKVCSVQQRTLHKRTLYSANALYNARYLTLYIIQLIQRNYADGWERLFKKNYNGYNTHKKNLMQCHYTLYIVQLMQRHNVDGWERFLKKKIIFKMS